ncbi:kinetochore protein mis14 like domain-containing protein [Sarocladium implicatum]|nr:kinetochore protein mis14 like domain-containing protein [Sarocladium implicatum]
MATDSIVSQVQRKIELQSPEDLSYLIANVRAAAAARLNEAFPHVDSQAGEDDLRDEIERLVNEYIDSTFTLASPNLTINGLPVPPSSINPASASTSSPAYEPFDTRKRRRLADLTTQEEKLLEEVASLKRSVPALAASRREAALTDALTRDDEDVRKRVEEARDKAEEEGEGLVDVLERQESVEEGFRSAVEGLGRLKREMPAVVARMERARVAGEYVVTGGRS